MKSPKFLFLLLSLALIAGCTLSENSERASTKAYDSAGSAKKETTTEGYVAPNVR